MTEVIFDKKKFLIFFLHLENTEIYFGHFWGMAEAKAREYFQGACVHFFVQLPSAKPSPFFWIY